MKFTAKDSPHLFHIPVMGTGFSIDTPLKVARYGISSAISLVDDVLIEQMRKFHCEKLGLQYQEISKKQEDSRAKRITAYLDLLDDLICDQVKSLQSSPFEPESEITRYFEMLPDSPLKKSYSDMLAMPDSDEKTKLQENLRQQAVPGSIDVNIMTKLDRDIYYEGTKLPQELADAMAALRGFARSKLQSSIIFSAGINRRLFGYINKFEDFLPDEKGRLRKKIVLKVSDYRSAMVQGKYMAKRGLWISEYRIESGLNCGGHAFATEGSLMGPILDEFGRKKTELIDNLHKLYNRALAGMKNSPINSPHEVKITVQGGIGTADENRFLLEHYRVNSTGWGTPFLLVPEVTNLDDVHIQKLIKAGNGDVYLSDHSPLGVPFWSLRNSASDETRRERISENKPGSPCPKGFAVSNTEFSEIPICRASRVYQKQKLEQLAQSDASPKYLASMKESVLAKFCICQNLAGSATLKYGIEPDAHPAVCCGPNIVNFDKVVTLEEMVSHIYGRLSLMTNPDRPHMFILELSLYVDSLRRELQKASDGLLDKTAKCFTDIKHNLVVGIEYYQELAEQFSQEQKERFLQNLDALFEEIEKILPESTNTISLGTVS